MTHVGRWKLSVLAALAIAPFAVTGCTTTTGGKSKTQTQASVSHVKSIKGVKTFTYTPKDRECLERAMFFESNRSSQDGLMAVGTVVMNRLVSGKYPDTICGVVGQKNQFAPGVLSRKMDAKRLPDVQAAADAVLKGKRHPKLKNSMFFHTAGLKFPYRNMHYVLVAGGNAFYEKRNRDGSLQSPVPDAPYNLALAYSPQSPSTPEGPSYDVTTPMADSAPAVQPTVQVALAEAAASTAPAQEQNQGTGPQARGDRLSAESAASHNQPNTLNAQQVHLASVQPQVENAAPEATTLGFVSVNEKQADAVGALLLQQDRPE